MRVIPFPSRKGEAGKRTDSPYSGLAERTPWRVRNTRFNLKLRADILVPFRKPRAPSEALLGGMPKKVGG